MSGVAETILEQLGGNAFRVMTGAKNFVGSDNSLSFRLPGRPGYVRHGINAVRIELKPTDTYAVEFYRVGKKGIKVKQRWGEVYADMLGDVFRNATGLETRLPKVKGL